MIDRDHIVGEDELNAYVDGELPADRRMAVEAWLARASRRCGASRRLAPTGRINPRALWRGCRRDSAAAVQYRPPDAPALRSAGGGRRRGRCGLPDRRRVGWTARGVETARPTDLALFTSDALDAYRLYVVEVRHPVEVPGDQRPHLNQWLSKRVGSPLRAPDLDKIGLKLVGGRLLPGPTGATAFFMYETPSGERFTLYCGRTSDRETALRYRTGEQNARLLLGRRRPRLCALRSGANATNCAKSRKPPTSRSIGGSPTPSGGRAKTRSISLLRGS